jgi:hypothetical protein
MKYEWNLHEFVASMKRENPKGREEQSSPCDKEIYFLGCGVCYPEKF